MLCSVPLECVYGTESCCGETFDSVKCVCSPTTGWTCLLTDACLKKSCTPSTSPSEGGANAENSTDILLKGCPHIPDGDTFPDFSMLCSVPLECVYGTESCCGETFDSVKCVCSPTTGWTCLLTDACLKKSCTPSTSPSEGGANAENSTDILLKGCPHIPDGDTFPDFSMLCSVPLDCFYGTESCCGETFDHIYCKCSPTAGWTCLFTDACYRKSCTPSKSPTAAGTNTENSNG